MWKEVDVKKTAGGSVEKKRNPHRALLEKPLGGDPFKSEKGQKLVIKWEWAIPSASGRTTFGNKPKTGEKTGG